MENLSCRVCGGPLTYPGRGAAPEMHPSCRTLSNDVARLQRALQLAWTEAEGQGARRRALRQWVLSELWRTVNQVTASAIPRKPPARPLERLDRFIKSLWRSQAGREALRSRGLALVAEDARGELFAKNSNEDSIHE